ncbi:MAG: NifB/NifX family molybdenum-iron cluster-binding protein [Candidatus Omnitrophota bacterium]|jgi:predicted Fe-Mo cluster-binding NifX family protein
MKICIPTEDNEGLNAKVDSHFGSAQFFTVYDTETKAVSTIDNTNAYLSQGMCHSIGVLGTASIDAVVCQGIGMGAVQKLNEVKIKAYRASGETVADIIKKYESNEAVEIIPKNDGTQHGCH